MSAWRISFTSCNSAALLNHSSFKQWRRQMGCSANRHHQLRLSFLNNQDNVKESSDMRTIEQAASKCHFYDCSKVEQHFYVNFYPLRFDGAPSKRTILINFVLVWCLIFFNLTTVSKAFKKLKRYGISGVLSYGLLNTGYYLSTFLFVWLYVVPVPGRMGYLGAAERFIKVLAMVWAGSQVTKLVRAGVALALAPAVDGGLSWFTVKFKFESQGKAFMAIAGFCFGLAFLLFLVVTLLWA